MLLDKFKELVLSRRRAYRHLFSLDGENRVSAGVVLNDLRKFCRATSSPAMVSGAGMIDPIATGIAIGRLEVWQRITQNLHLSDADIIRLMEKDTGTE